MNTLHWLKNEDRLPVSLQVSGSLRARKAANLDKANEYLRRLGLRPTLPGASPAADRVKAGVFAAAVGVRRRFGVDG